MATIRKKLDKNDTRWFLAEKGEVWRTLIGVARRVSNQLWAQSRKDVTHFHIYQGFPAPVWSKMAQGVVGYGMPLWGGPSHASWNVARSICDTFVSEMIASEPKAGFATADADWTMQQQAKSADAWCDGLMRDQDFWYKRRRVTLDTTIWGDGVMKVTPDKARSTVAIGRTLPFFLMQDAGDSLWGEPGRAIYERRWVDRLLLLSEYGKDPKLAQAIRESKRISVEKEGVLGAESTADQICVTEAYHLPSGPNEKDGMHALCIDGADLFVESWTRERWPYANWTRQPAPIGFRSVGLVEEVYPMHQRINGLLRKVDKTMWLNCVNRVFYAKGSINTLKMNDEDGAIVAVDIEKSQGQMPVISPGQGVNEQVLEVINLYKQAAFEFSGVSPAAAMAVLPAGLSGSGEAQRVYNNKASARFMAAAKNDEAAVLRVTQLVEDAARDLHDSGVKLKVAGKVGRGGLTMVDFGAVMSLEKNHIVQMYPVSALSKDPAERAAQIADDVKSGIMDLATARRLRGAYDVDEQENVDDASSDLVRQTIDFILEGEEYEGPIPVVDATDAIKWVKAAICRAHLQHVEQSRIKNLETYLQQIVDIVSPPPAAPMPPEQLGATGQAPPTPAPPMPPGGAPPMPMPPQGPPPGAPMQ